MASFLGLLPLAHKLPATREATQIALKTINAKPYKKFRIPFTPREAIAIRKLRMHHWPILNIAKLLHRSTSFVHRRLAFQLQFYWKLRKLRFEDLRKLPTRMKSAIAAHARRIMVIFGPKWLHWINNEEGKPP